MKSMAQMVDNNNFTSASFGSISKEQLAADWAEIEAMRNAIRGNFVRCYKCHDAGFLRDDSLSINHPDFGKPIPCDGDSHGADNVRRLAKLSQLSPTETTININDIMEFHADLKDDKCHICPKSSGSTLVPYKKEGQLGFKCSHCGLTYYGKPSSNVAMLDWAKRFIGGQTGFGYGYGGWGNGKTEVAKAIVNGCAQAGRVSVYANFSKIVSYIKASWENNSTETEEQRFNKLVNCQVLVIDELDKVQDTQWLNSLRVKLFDARYNGARRGGDKTTIVFSNLSPDHLDGALLSRFMQDFAGDRVVENTAPDLRRVMEY
jgi:hypothetical protein